MKPATAPRLRRSSRRGPASVTVSVPGTSANLGPGFDTLGLALRLHNRARVTPVKGREITITSPLAEDARAGATDLVREAATLFYRRTRKPFAGFDIELTGDVPIARGLGSSVTVRLGTVAALNEITRAQLTRQDLFQIVAELEGHPDNAAPATFGGFTASTMVHGVARAVRFPIPRHFQFVTLIPPFEVPTSEARRLVPLTFSKADTVHCLTRVSVITAAFAAGEAEALRGLFDDRIHQPYREKLIPQLSAVLRAGERAGAVGGWLSGSGSTMICLAIDRVEAVRRAMARELPGAKTLILPADARGFAVL